MADYIDADCRLCRREGCKLFLKGNRCLSSKCSFDKRPTAPGAHGKDNRRKISEYGTQLREKQKVKRMYGVLERQFRNYYEKATRLRGNTGEIMLRLLEERLDNTVYRLGLAASRAQARQFVSHGLITVNGKVLNIPSYSVNVGDVIAVKPSKKDYTLFKELKDIKVVVPKWLELNLEELSGKVIAEPKRDDSDLDIKEYLIIELYSK